MAIHQRSIRVGGMSCVHCERAIAQGLSSLPGVIDVEAAAHTGTVVVYHSGELQKEQVRAAVDGAGYALETWQA